MKDQIMGILRQAFDEISPMLEKEVAFDEDLRIFGEEGILDSIGLVSFVATLEDLIREELDLDILLITDKAFSKKSSPFHTVTCLYAFIDDLIKEARQ